MSKLKKVYYRNVYYPPRRISSGKYSIEVRAAANIKDTIAEAISVADCMLDVTIQFEFNDVIVSVRSDSNPELIHRDWLRSLNGYIGKNVGPNPNPVLTDKEKASDARIENKRKCQECQNE